MSYCRWNKDCNVYLYASVYGGFSINVSVDPSLNEHLNTRAETIAYLIDLMNKGIKVPQQAIDRLTEEMMRNKPEPEWDGSFF